MDWHLGEAAPSDIELDEQDMCLEYFRAQQVVKAASSLNDFVDSTDEATSAVAGLLSCMLSFLY